MSEQAPFGVIFDFFLGARIILPPYDGRIPRKVRLYDYMAPPYEIPFGKEQKYVNTKVGFFVKYKLEILEGDSVVFTHDYDCRNKTVVITSDGVLGDNIAWMSSIEQFRKLHGCKLIVGMHREYIPLFKHQYPEIVFYDDKELDENWVAKRNIYAAYILSYRSDDRVCILRKIDSRQIGLHHVAQDALGLNFTEAVRPRINIMSPNKRPIKAKEKYVVIATAAGGVFKMWNNPSGWADVAKHLHGLGYRVICLDKEATYRNGGWPQYIEDQTGHRPLTERARWLAHADLFIGLSSGLSWLAWAVGTPVVMISGFSLPFIEFENPYRVINTDVCTGCWNDMSIPAPTLTDFTWCPRHKGTPREYECSRMISSEQVIAMVDRALADRQAKENPA